MTINRRASPPESRQGGEGPQQDPIQNVVRSRHNIRPQRIIRLIQSSLESAGVDPIPQRIVIDNIVITRQGNRLRISCTVQTY